MGKAKKGKTKEDFIDISIEGVNVSPNNKEKKQELTEEDKELLDDGIIGVLKQIKQAKPEKSEYWGVLDRLNTSDEDLMLKTNLPNPLAVAALKTYKTYLEKIHPAFKKPAETIDNFLDRFMEARISNEGEGRRGTLEVLKSIGRNEEVIQSNEVLD